MLYDVKYKIDSEINLVHLFLHNVQTYDLNFTKFDLWK